MSTTLQTIHSLDEFSAIPPELVAAFATSVDGGTAKQSSVSAHTESSSCMEGITAVYERTSEVIGSGAFSTVYKGFHRITGVPVAVKVFNEDDDSSESSLSMQQRFQHTVHCFERLSEIVDGSPPVKGMTPPKQQKLSVPPSVSVHSDDRVPETPASWKHSMSPISKFLNSPIKSFERESFSSASPIRSPTIVSDENTVVSFGPPSVELSAMLRLATERNELVVKMLDYSKNADGSPGKDAITAEYWLVMELGDYSLEEFIQYRHESSSPLSSLEIRSLLWDVIRMACLLHSYGLAHLDIKPGNIMLFNSSMWKLIDFDGCYRSSTKVDVMDSDIAFTPLYCAPEIAASILNINRNDFKVSRLMDVWSIGAIAAELCSLKPLFEQPFNDLYDWQSNDDTEFLRWLANPMNPVDLSSVKTVADPPLLQLIQERLLVKDITKRATLPEILQDPFFKSHQLVNKYWGPIPLSKSSCKTGQVHKSPRFIPCADLHLSSEVNVSKESNLVVSLLAEHEPKGTPRLSNASDFPIPSINSVREQAGSTAVITRLLDLFCCRRN